jgi:hypothetical protein
MKFLIVVLLLTLIGCRPAKDKLGCDDVFDQLPELTSGYTLDTIKDDPVSVMPARGTCVEAYFDKMEGLVGYFRYGDVTVVITSYPGDDMYLVATTFRDGRKVDSTILSHGYGGFIGCGYNGIEELLGMTSPTTITTVQKTTIADCDENDEEIPGTSNIAVVKTTFEFTSDGMIVMNSTSKSG